MLRWVILSMPPNNQRMELKMKMVKSARATFIMAITLTFVFATAKARQTNHIESAQNFVNAIGSACGIVHSNPFVSPTAEFDVCHTPELNADMTMDEAIAVKGAAIQAINAAILDIGSHFSREPDQKKAKHLSMMLTRLTLIRSEVALCVFEFIASGE